MAANLSSNFSPLQVIDGIKRELRLPAAALQIPIGLEENFGGVVDLVDMQSIAFDGEKGTKVVRGAIPSQLQQQADDKRRELIENLADVDDDIAELFIGEIEPTSEQLRTAIRKQTIARKFVPVFMGSVSKLGFRWIHANISTGKCYHNQFSNVLIPFVFPVCSCPITVGI